MNNDLEEAEARYGERLREEMGEIKEPTNNLGRRMALRRAVLAEQKEKAKVAKANRWANEDMKKHGFLSNLTRWKIQTFCDIDCDYIPGLDDGAEPEQRTLATN